jgi:hypothetical protein
MTAHQVPSRAWAVSLVLAVFVAGCTLSPHASDHASISVNARGGRSASPPPTSAIYPGDATNAVTLHIELSKTVWPDDGTAIPATLVIDNTTGGPVDAPGGCTGRFEPYGWAQIGLTSPTVPYQQTWSQEACGPIPMPLGLTRWPMTVLTIYKGCFPTGPAPRCIGPNDSEDPPLPAGHYTTDLALAIPPGYALARAVHVAPAIQVTLIRRADPKQ